MRHMRKYFVTFYSPGTFVPEESTKEIESWDVDKAQEMAHDIVERYGATPFSFRFTTRARGPEDFDSKIVETSPLYYLGGKVETLEEVEKRNDPSDSDKILLRNMRGNGIKRVIVNTNSWRHTAPLHDHDIVLDWKPRKKSD